MHLAVSGNIGSGKTTLAYLLAKYFHLESYYEDNEQNPYLMDFYADMHRWAFHLQIQFLHSRLRKVMEIHKQKLKVVQDRTLYEDAQIFAPNLHAMGLMTTREYETYKELFETVAELVQPPDLLIHLKGSVPVLVEQIQSRNRKYEDNIRLDYLKRLNDRYEEWYQNYNYGKKIEISIDELNFRDNPEHLGVIINKVRRELHGGLFNQASLF